MFQTLSFLTSAFKPLKLNYVYDEQIKIKGKIVTFNDGFTTYQEPILYCIKDIQINRSNIFYLTSAVQLNNVIDIQTEDITLDKLQNKFSLKINNKFVASPDFKILDVNQDRNGNSSFLRFTPNADDTISINLVGKNLTISRFAPFNLTFQDVIGDDIFNEQKFIVTVINNNSIKIKTKVTTIDNSLLSRYLSYDVNDGNRIKPCGDVNHNYIFDIVYQIGALSAINTNFNGKTYWVKYFNENATQNNNSNAEIDFERSIVNVPVNLLINSAFKKNISISDANINVNFNNLKNFQTPEYEYTDNSFYINKYRIYGNISIMGAPLAYVPLSGFTDEIITNENGDYSALVDYDWSGIVQPNNPEYAFVPAQTNYTNVEAEQLQNYTATVKYFTVSGTVYSSLSAGVDSIFIDAQDFSAITDGAGHYSFNVPFNWSGVLSAVNTNTDPVSALLINTQSNTTQNFYQV